MTSSKNLTKNGTYHVVIRRKKMKFFCFCSKVSILHSLMTVSTRFTAVLNVRLSQVLATIQNFLHMNQRKIFVFGDSDVIVLSWPYLVMPESRLDHFVPNSKGLETMGRRRLEDSHGSRTNVNPEIFFLVDILSSLERKTGAAMPFFRLTCERWDLSTQLLLLQL